MKNIIFVIAALAITACSSTKKTPAPEADASHVEQKVMEATSSDVDTKIEKTVKKGKKEVKEVSTTTPAANGGSLPAITGTEKSAVTCSNKGDTRKITTLAVAEGGCGVVYNKAGEDKTVALAKTDMKYCDTVTGKIKTNLEGAGFNCGGAESSSDAPATKH